MHIFVYSDIRNQYQIVWKHSSESYWLALNEGKKDDTNAERFADGGVWRRSREVAGSWFGKNGSRSRETQHLMTRVSFGNSIYSEEGWKGGAP